MTKLVTLGIFSAAVTVVIAKLVKLGILPLTPFVVTLRAVVIAKLLILGISSLTSFILVLRVVIVDKMVISGILSSAFFILALYTSLSLLISTGAGTNLSTSNLSSLLFKLLKLFGTLFNL